MKQPDLENFIIEKAELQKTIDAAGDNEATAAANRLLISLESSLERRINADINDTTEAIYKLKRLLEKELAQAV